MLIHHRNVSIVNFTWGQKVVPAGWLPAADRLELRHNTDRHKSNMNVTQIAAKTGIYDSYNGDETLTQDTES